MRIFHGCERLFLKAREKSGRTKRISVCCLLFILFGLSTSVLADDIEIYTAGGDGVEPNVLIIFDNSNSMNDSIPSAIYDSAEPYPGSYETNTVYYRWQGSWDHVFRDSIANIACVETKTALENEGFYNGKIEIDSTCGGHTTRFLRTGNYLNFLGTNPPAQRPKLGVAKGTIQSFVNTTYGIRFGAMIFNPNQGGHLLREVRDMTPQNRSDLHSAIGGISAETETPLAETLFETGLYFAGSTSYFNPGVNYTSPITHWCQKNYVIVISDGLSTQDRDPVLQTIGNNGNTDGDDADPGTYENEGSDYLDDVAKYLYDLDLSNLEDKQNIRTYTIGFTINQQLLEDTAENGRGRYYYVHNAQSFSIVFQTLMQEILEESTSFTAPVVPISQMEKTTSANRIYLAQFKPAEGAFWKGNIKKFSIATEEADDINLGDVLDVNEDKATDDNGHILNTAVSFWGSFDPDGGETEAGGVGEVLLNRAAPRNIYTWLDVNERPLTHPNNAFVDGNPKLTNALLEVADDTERGQAIDFVYGYDAYDEDMDFDTTEKRHWILGAFLHSRPAVVTYNESTSVIFAGANDGMLHAFLDTDGTELWAFIPPDRLGRLKRLHGGVLEYFVDGAPKAAVMDQDGDGVIESAEGDQVILVFGQRRGGSHYYALDVTDPNGPKYLWDISPDQVDFSEIGQSWSTPVIGNLKIGQDDRMVVFLGGGYDTNQDDDPVAGLDTAGRGIYVVDLLDGGLVWKSTFDPVSNPSMSYCISSDVAAIDTEASGYIDRLYVGDTGGQMWRCDIGDPDPANWTAKRIFDDSGNGRKIFYPPDVVLEHGYEMLFWGTGDRANPRNESIVNRIYGLKDRNPDSPLTEDDLVNVTANLIQDGTEQERADTLNALNSHDGWYINLAENPGEKVLAPSITYFGAAYLSTFTPTAGDPFDLCYVGEGTARLYALDYKTAAAVLNFDTSSDDLDKGDRSKVIGAAIPSGMVIAIIQGESTSFIGVGGGISTSDIVHPTAITRIYWRQSF
jgi:type IV pilus assembly protein PilY1